MKKIALILPIALFLQLSIFAQDDTNNNKWYTEGISTKSNFMQELYFEVRGNYSHPVKKEKLNEAKLINDIIPGYPENWINQYISVEILAMRNGNSMKTKGLNNVLSPEQKNILQSTELGAKIEIIVNYKSKNPVTEKIENYMLNFSLIVIPETEAEYVGGYQQLAKYIKENVINKISKTTPTQFQSGIVIFTINEKGEIVDAKISKSSGDSMTDKFLIESVNKMPKWKPAENSNGIKVKQEFQFSFGNKGC